MENSNGVGREPPGNSNNNNRKPKDQKGQSRGSGKLRRQAVGTMNRNAKESGGTERGLAKHHHPNNNRPFVTQTRTRKVSIGPDTGRKMRRDDPRMTEATGNSTGDSTAASATNADVCRICKESTHMMTMEQKDKQICFRCVYRTCACCGKENGIATTLMIKKESVRTVRNRCNCQRPHELTTPKGTSWSTAIGIGHTTTTILNEHDGRRMASGTWLLKKKLH